MSWRKIWMPLEKRPCMKCQQNLATVKFTTIRNGAVEERYLCATCAASQSPYQKKALPQLDEILSGILGVALPSEAAAHISPAEPTCANCGLPYSSYRQTLILGCSDCYESFEKLLVNELRRFHGATKHTGRVPHSQVQQVRNERNEAELKARLAEAVKAEDFGLAARLRDQLRELTQKNEA
jgi:protein arginine kinase activator